MLPCSLSFVSGFDSVVPLLLPTCLSRTLVRIETPLVFALIFFIFVLALLLVTLAVPLSLLIQLLTLLLGCLTPLRNCCSLLLSR